MKTKVTIVFSIFCLVTITAVFLCPRAILADYSFWYGTDITRATMDNPNFDPTKPPGPTNPEKIVTRPGLTQEQASALATALGAIQPGMFGSNNNPLNDRDTTLWAQGETWDGYTLLCLLAGYKPMPDGPTYNAVLVDMDGSIVNKWQLTGFPVKMLPNGSILGGKGQFDELVGIPYLVQQDWCGNDEWVWKGAVKNAWQAEKTWSRPKDNNRCDGLYPEGPYSASNPLGCKEQVYPGDLIVSGWHHDFQREGNPVGYYFPGAESQKVYKGKTLVLANYLPPTTETCPPSGSDEDCISRYRLYDEAIYIVDWNGNVEFEWFPYQHINEMGFLPKAREAIRETRSGAGNNETANDYQHFNNVNWVGKNRWWDGGDRRFNPEYIIWDARSSNITAIIATSDHPRGDWKAGDIVWKIGPNYQAPYDPESRLGQIVGQHMAHMIPKGLPGAGNMLIFDNGGGAGWGPLMEGLPLLYTPGSPLTDPSRSARNNTLRNYSRIIEFNPVTMDIVWEYAQPNPTADLDGDGRYLGDERFFFSFFISGAQRLKNGNTMITEGMTGRVFEVTPEKRVVWEFISPFGGGGSGLPGIIGPVYRAYRVPYKWAPKKMSCP